MDTPEVSKDRGAVGYLVVIAILTLIAIALLVSYIVIASKLGANFRNQNLACPNYVCADGTTPVQDAILCATCATEGNPLPKCQQCLTPV
jgi:hypothetical protein